MTSFLYTDKSIGKTKHLFMSILRLKNHSEQFLASKEIAGQYKFYIKI